MSEINLLKIDGKPIEKLIGVIGKGIGTVYKPRAIRKEADAKAYKIEIIERAKSKASSEGKEIEAATFDRIQERLVHKEFRRQNNIDQISQIAAEQIAMEETVSDEPVDDDWTARFFNIVEDISDEEMQNLWGRILAGEVKEPNTYSLRTLELLKNLDKKEAECFVKYGKLALTSSGSGVSFIINFKREPLLKDKYDLNVSERLLLDELGLLNSKDLQFEIFGTKDKGENRVFIIGDTCIIADLEPHYPQVLLDVLILTKMGQELLGLIETKPQLDYIQLVASKIRKNGAKVRYAKISHIEDGLIHHKDLKDVPLTDQEVENEKKRLVAEEQRRKREALKAELDKAKKK